jgi:hypothetical protein
MQSTHVGEARGSIWRLADRAVQNRADQPMRPLAHRRRGRDRHPRVGRLVQQPPATHLLRRPHPRRIRTGPLPSTPSRRRDAGWSQHHERPDTPGRFTGLSPGSFRRTWSPRPATWGACRLSWRATR